MRGLAYSLQALELVLQAKVPAPSAKDVMQRTGRTKSAVQMRRYKLGVRGSTEDDAKWQLADDNIVRNHRPSEAAKKLGRTLRAVYGRRVILKLPDLRRVPAAKIKRRKRKPAPPIPWKRWEDELVRTLAPAEVAERTGRTVGAVYVRRRKIGATRTPATR
jgi:hypothetical protein